MRLNFFILQSFRLNGLIFSLLPHKPIYAQASSELQHPSSRLRYIADKLSIALISHARNASRYAPWLMERMHAWGISLGYGNGDMFLSNTIPHRMFADILLFELCCRNCAEVTRYNVTQPERSITGCWFRIFSEAMLRVFQSFYSIYR